MHDYSNKKLGERRMKIQEFRNKMQQCKREDLEKIASELYKMLPKNKKEEDADTLIEDIIAGKTTAVSAKNQKADVNFDVLKSEINEFLSNVDNDYYIVPNRIVPKSKRSKWRFEVKKFVKSINQIPVDGENGIESAQLLRELYQRLCYGCGYYIFPSDDPFQSIGIRQPVFYDMLIKRTFATGFTDENIKNMLMDATCVYIDRESLYIEMEAIYAKSLLTSDLKYKAQGFIKEYVEQLEAKSGKKNKYALEDYQIKSNIDEMCQTMLIISIFLCEPEDGIKYYWKHNQESNKEVTLYKLLNIIKMYGDDKLWISVYENGLSKKIEPRNALKEQYQEKKSK